MQSLTTKQRRFAELLRQGPDLSAVECVELALMQVRLHRSAPDPERPRRWWVGEKADATLYSTFGAGQRARYEQALDLAVKLNDGNLEGLVRYGDQMMPVVMRRMAHARLRAEKGIPRKKWKWSEEARARVAGKKDAAPRKRGYPLFELTPAFDLPETGHRFTVTRETLETLRRMILPEGME